MPKNMDSINIETQFNKALHLLDFGKTEKAMDILHEIVADSKDCNTILYIRSNCVLGELLFSNGRENEAKPYLAEVVNTFYENDVVDYEKSIAANILTQIK